MSVSAWMTDAARRTLAVREGLAEVSRWEGERGAFSEEELDLARRHVFGRAGSRTQKRPAR